MSSDWEATQVAGSNALAQAPPSPQQQHSGSSGGGGVQAAQTSMLSTPGPHPLPAYLKQLGMHVAALAAREHVHAPSRSNATAAASPSSSSSPPTPLLCAFVARALMLEAEESASARGETSEYPLLPPTAAASSSSSSSAAGGAYTISLPPAVQEKLIKSTLHRLAQQDDPLLETLKMQASFESMYATEVARKRASNYALDQANSQQLARILEVGTNISSNAQVAALYRAIFKLMLANGCVDQPGADGSSPSATAGSPPAPTSDRNVDREIAAALESVFPQSGLNAFNLLSPQAKRAQVLALINIVLGIRLFNRDICKGGAGLGDVPGLAATESDALYEEMETESAALGDVCYTYADVLNLELQQPGSIAASVVRLQAELCNRRQYLLLLHQLQHEVIEASDLIADARRSSSDLCTELRTLVGLRSSVPKESVYPKFQALATHWRLLREERAMQAMRKRIFTQVLLRFRQSFGSNLLEEDIALVRNAKRDPKAQAIQAAREEKERGVDFDEFVETAPAASTDGAGAGNEEEKQQSSGGAMAAASYRPLRLVQDSTPGFMSLPLEFQGYCPWALVHRGGLLLPGDPALGIVRVLGRHYSFSSASGMRDFCEDPERYIEGVLSQARRNPALIHLLCLQPYIPHSDVSELFALESMMADQSSSGSGSGGSGGPKVSAGSQTPFHINTDLPDPNYHWNEWELRRSALQLAELTKMRTVGAQTNLSHFRRDNSSQYTLAPREADGTAAGVGTQTGVEKSSQVERIYRFHTGLRGKPDKGAADPGAQMKVVQLSVPAHVEDATNSSLQLKPHESLKTRIVRERH